MIETMPTGLIAAMGFVVGVLAAGLASAENDETRQLPRGSAAVGFATAVLFAVAVHVIGLTPVLPAYLWFVAVTVTLAVTDLTMHLIPNRLLFPATIIGGVLLTGGALLAAGPLVRPYLGGAVYFAGLYLIARLSKGAFGGGDVKLAFLLGIFATYRSWTALIVGIAAAFLLGGLAGITVMALGLRDRREAIAFGPYLIAGTYVGIAVAEPVARWYLGGSA